VRIRSLALAALTAVALVPVTAVPALAATTSGSTATAVSDGIWKSGATRRPRVRTTSAAALTTPTPSYADRVLALTNLERSRRGLRTLALSSCADGFADSWAATLVARGALSHQPLSPILSACRARAVGENVAYGYRTADEMVQGWMASPGHRANILNSTFSHLGVGAGANSAGRWYGVQVFLTL
jgi:uncharacterized protein YkwD